MIPAMALHTPPGQSPLPFPGSHGSPSFVPPTQMPPPGTRLQLPPEVLLVTMLLTTVTVPPLPTAMAALLPEKVLLVTVRMSKLLMAPPMLALLPEEVLLVKVTVCAVMKMAPPP